MERFFGIFGILFILGISYLMSNNKKAIDLKPVLSGLILQVLLAIFVLKTTLGKTVFATLGQGVEKLLEFADKGGEFVFGFIAQNPEKLEAIFGSSFIFAIKLTTALIFVAVVVNILYHAGIMQRIIAVLGKAVNKLMSVSGAEALSNISSPIVGQVQAQLMIKPYLPTLTNSELFASMTGSMACVAAGVLAIYISMGIPAEYLLAANAMAIPGAFVISKIMFPETEEPQTKGEVKMEVKKTHLNLMDAISSGASTGMQISINVIAMLIGLLALVAMIDFFLGAIGGFLAAHTNLSLAFMGIELDNLSLKAILGSIFSVFAYLMGVPQAEILDVGSLMGTKLVLNEFIAYIDLLSLMDVDALSQKSIAISSFALCGFACLGSVAIQIGGIGKIAENRKKDLAVLGMKALIAGTLASYVSAAIAGILCA